MNRLFFKFIFLTATGFVLTINASAQLCGTYSTTLIIKDSGGKPIENAAVRLVRIKKDETKGEKFVRDENDSSKFTITFYEGHLIYEKYKLIISADGFESLEKEINFPHCKRQQFDIQLEIRKKVNTAVLTGTVKLDKKIIKGAVIRIRDAGSNEYSATTDEKGIYRVSLPFGKYSIYSTVNDKCWMCAEFYRNDFLINKEGKIKLNIELQFFGEG